jgi:4-amino-4-deoxy-L-arabinose transferase-like glycosyltransferase
MAVGLLARLALIAWTTPLEPSLDEARFWDLAGRGMSGTAFLPPLYPLALAAARAVGADSHLAARLLSVCMSTASIALVHILARRHFSGTVGAAPAWIAALLPTLVHYDGRIRSESLVILLLLGFAVLWTGRKTAGRARILWAGLILGFLALARPEFLLFPMLLLLIELKGGGGLPVVRRGLLLLPGLVIVVLPWTVRNHVALGVDALISTNGGYNFWKSFNEMTDGSQVPVTDFSLWEEVSEREMDAVGYREGLRYIREHPGRSLLLVPAKWGHLFGPERDFLSDVRRDRFPARARWLDIGFALAQNAVWFLLIALGLYALLGPRGSPVKDVALAVLLTLLIVHAVFFGDDRFHVPLLPFLCIILPESWDGARRSAARIRLFGLALTFEALFWIGILVRDLPRVLTIGGA